MIRDSSDHTYTPEHPEQRPRLIEYPPQQSTYPPIADDATSFTVIVRSTSSRSSHGMPEARSLPPGGMARSPAEVSVEYTTRSIPAHRSNGHSGQPQVQSHQHQRLHGPAHASQPRHPPPQQQKPFIPLQIPEQPFEYSKCTGRKKAVCIGINYIGQKDQLSGCINDAKDIAHFLIHHYGYKAENIILLADDATNPRHIPTRKNMLDAMRWLVEGAHKHDSLHFHYSGHGSRVKDRNGDEVDGFDEVICPVDFRKSGIILDDLMHEIMVKNLPTGCRLTALFDSCHSGTALDLPYLYHSNGRLKGSSIARKQQAAKASTADVISFSGCKDTQTSADAWEGGVAAGAMSYAFMKSLKANPNQTYKQLLISVRKLLSKKYSQKPQLSSSHKIDTNIPFIM